MTKMRKGLGAIVLLLMLTFGISTIAYADTDEAVSVEIKTDKEAYEIGDEIVATVTITNGTGADLADVNVEVEWPATDLVECQDSVVSIDKLATGESQTVEVKGTVLAKAMNPYDYTGWMIIITCVVLLIVAIALVVFFVIKKKRKMANLSAIVLLVAIAGITAPMLTEAKEVCIDATTSIKLEGNASLEVTAHVTYVEYEMKNTAKHVTVHDPSIIYDSKTDMYYIYGSHRAWAKSEDMISWTTFQNNINKEYKTMFEEPAKWAANGGTQGAAAYSVAGNLWAPDVVYNEAMGKWTMYMSVNGDNWYSSIVLLTADTPDGDWTYVGPVVYSGFTNAEEAKQTDFYDVYSGTDFPARYNQNRNGNHTYGLNAIDPSVFYDEEERLWLSYGSWFGGIYLLELDPATGLRLASHTYETVEGVSDEYQGIKIAGGDHVSGEAPYIEYVDGNYYLYVTLGGLTANGGYNMRVFKADSPEGPYLDISGDSAIYDTYANNINGSVGVRVMSNYMWDYMEYGYVAQGHNSAYSDENGNLFVVYHTRFDNNGETHQVRVHQQFINEDGWLVTAPFEYTGEVLREVDTEDVAGVYSMLYHKLGVDYGNKECVTTVAVELKADGTVAGAYKGTWAFSEAKGTPYVTMVIDGVEYKGVFVKQKLEESTELAMTFTVVGDNEINLWGYKLDVNDEDMVNQAAEELSMPVGTLQDLTLPTEGTNATTITWTSSNEAIIATTGKVTRPSEDTIVTLTATISRGSVSVKKDFDVRVIADFDSTKDKMIWNYNGEAIDLTSVDEQGACQFANPFHKNNTLGLDISNGVSIKFTLYRGADADVFHNIMSFNANAQGGLYIMDMAYLGFKTEKGWFDANIKNANYVNTWQAGTNFIPKKSEVEIRLLPTGFEYYVNGELVYNQDDIPYYTSTELIADDASDKVPGISQLKSYMEVLTYLSETATVMNLGWGSWWNGGYEGHITDIELSVLGAPEVDFKGNHYLEQFVTGAPIMMNWISHEHGTLSAEYSDEHGYYLQYFVSGVSGNRGVYTILDEAYQLDGNYTFEADIKLNSGYNRDTEFVLLGSDYNQIDYTGNKVTAETGYIFRMKIATGTENAAITGSDKTVSIAKDTWTHIKITVSDNGKVVAQIGNQTVTTQVNGNGKLAGIFALCARSDGLFAIDNIIINPN